MAFKAAKLNKKVTQARWRVLLKTSHVLCAQTVDVFIVIAEESSF